MTNVQLHQVNYSLSEISFSLGKVVTMALGIVILVVISFMSLFFVNVAAMILSLIILVSLNKWGANSNQKFMAHKQSSELLQNSARATSHQKIMFCWMMSKHRSTSISLLIQEIIG
jgi:hypothetical protein